MFSNRDGLPAYKGYEYQMYVTIRTALYLIFKEKLCTEIIIEPATEEDIATNLTGVFDKVITTLEMPLIKKPIQAQVKLRSVGPLDVSEFVNIISNNDIDIKSHGPASRKRPIQLLNEDTELMYLLIITSEVNKSLKPFVVESIGDFSLANTENTPATIKALSPETGDDLLKRIGILEQQVPNLLIFEIKDYLTKYCHVPPTKHEDCINELVSCVRARLLGLIKKEWTEGEIRETIYKHSGFPFVNKIMSSYVEPSNYLQIKYQIEKKNKLLIIGTPGVGKTLTADMIEYEYSISSNPYEVVKKEVGIGGIKSCLKKVGRYLFYLEDPWGYNSLSSEALAWMCELPKLLEQASEDKKFLITSRISILEQAALSKKSLEFIKDDCITIIQENYDKDAREKILLNKIIYLRPWQKDFVNINKSKIINRLTVPISLERFVALLGKETEESKVKIDTLLQKSLLESIHATVVEEISNMGEDAIASSIALWLLIATGEEITIENARLVRKYIKEKDIRYELDIQKQIEWMERASWLHLKGCTYYMHPTTLSGIEEIVTQNSAKAEDIICSFLESLVRKNKEEQAYNIISKLKNRNQLIPDEINNIITKYLLNELMSSSDAEFLQKFNRVDLWSNANDPVTLITKALCVMNPNNGFFGSINSWHYPKWNDEHFNSIKTSQEAQKIARNFIRIILPSSFSFYGEGLVDLFSKLEWDFSIECQDLLELGVTGSIMNEDILIRLAMMSDPSSYEKVLNIILSDLSCVEEWWEDFVDQYNRALQAEYDFEYINHIIEEPSERFTPVENSLKLIVSYWREKEGYSWILLSPAKNKLIKPWAESICESNNLTTKEELEALIAECDSENMFRVWKCISKSNCRELIPAMLYALKDSPYEDLEYCLNALCVLLSAQELENLLLNISMELGFIRKTYLVLISKSMRFDGEFKYVDEKSVYIKSIQRMLDDEELSFAECLEKIQNEETVSIDKNHIPNLLTWINEVPNLYSIIAIEALARTGFNIDDIAYNMLKNSKDYKTRYNVLVILTKLGIQVPQNVFFDSLKDKDYHVRELAIKIIARTATQKEKLAIIKMHTDESAPVRVACANIIGEMRWDFGIDVLCTLIFDKRNLGGGGDRNFSNNINYHVARVAALAFNNFKVIPSEAIEKIIYFINQGEESSKDIVVHYYLIETLAKQNHEKILNLFELFLENNWYMLGSEKSGFPLRYAAIRGILVHLINFPEKINNINIISILKAANHSDDRLAAPALIILGILHQKSKAYIRDALNQEELTADRVILLLATFMLEDNILPSEFYDQIIPYDYAGKKVLDFYLENELIDEKKWRAFINNNVEVEKWVNTVDSGKGIGPYLAFVINQLFNERGYIPLAASDIKNNELAENIQMFSTYAMIGGE